MESPQFGSTPDSIVNKNQPGENPAGKDEKPQKVVSKKPGRLANIAAVGFIAASSKLPQQIEGIPPWALRDVQIARGIPIVQEGHLASENLEELIAQNLTLGKMVEPQVETGEVIQKPDAFELVFKNLAPDKKAEARKFVDAMEKEYKSYPEHLKKIFDVTNKWEGVVQENARRVNFPEELALGIFFVENSGGENEVNRQTGARGVAQLLPDTAREYGLRVDNRVDERTDPIKSIKVMSEYLGGLAERFASDPGIAAWGYHAGPGTAYKALREYANANQFADPGDIMTDDGNTALVRMENYRRLVRENKINIHDVLSNPQVYHNVIEEIGTKSERDTTEEYVYRAVAGYEIFKEMQGPR